MPCEDEGRDRGDVPTSQGMPVIARRPQEAAGGPGTDLPSQPPEGTNPALVGWSQPPSWTCSLLNWEAMHFCFLSHPGRGNLLH